MRLLRAYKTELDPNNALRTLLLQHAGARRWAYNYLGKLRATGFHRL